MCVRIGYAMAMRVISYQKRLRHSFPDRCDEKAFLRHYVNYKGI